MLRDLKFSYVEFMINSAASVLLQFLTLNRWGRLSDLFGNRLILITTGAIIPIMPTLWLILDQLLLSARRAVRERAACGPVSA